MLCVVVVVVVVCFVLLCVVVLLLWVVVCCCVVICSKRKIIVGGADLSEKKSLNFIVKICVFVSRSTEIVTFLRKTVTPKMGCCFFILEKDTFLKKTWNSSKISSKKIQQRQTLEIGEGFACEAKHFGN